MWQQLDQPQYFYVLLLIPALVLLFLWNAFWKKRKQKEFADAPILALLSPEKSVFKPFLKLIVISLGILGVTLALVNPKIGTKIETVKRQGVDIVFAIDVSKSMLAEDVAPNRLEKAKQIVTQVINGLGSDRIGIVAYAGSAFPVLPITTDYSVAKMYLQNMNTDMVSSQGTAFDDAIKISSDFFDDPETSKMIIMLSDGEDHGEGFEEVVAQAKESGVKIITVGLGTEKGGPIPIRYNGTIQSYKKDQEGETVLTKLVPETLKTIAEQGNGGYVYGGATKDVVEFVKNGLDNLEKKDFESQEIAEFESQFQWFLFFGVLFLVLDAFLLERKTSWVTKLNLFNEKKNDTNS